MKTILFTVVILALASSCLPKLDKTSLKFNGVKNPTETVVVDETITFDDLKTTVLAPKCLSCHAKWSDEAAFQSKYMVLGDADNSKMFDSVKKGRMPKGPKLPDGTREIVAPLNSKELETVRLYIQSATKVFPKVTFEELKTKILDTKCITCHKKWTSEEIFQKNNVVAGFSDKSRVYDSVMANRMPKARLGEDGLPQAVTPLSPEEKEMFRNYIQTLKPKTEL